jgi:hypothetical protein
MICRRLLGASITGNNQTYKLNLLLLNIFVFFFLYQLYESKEIDFNQLVECNSTNAPYRDLQARKVAFINDMGLQTNGERIFDLSVANFKRKFFKDNKAKKMALNNNRAEEAKNEDNKEENKEQRGRRKYVSKTEKRRASKTLSMKSLP